MEALKDRLLSKYKITSEYHCNATLPRSILKLRNVALNSFRSLAVKGSQFQWDWHWKELEWQLSHSRLIPSRLLRVGSKNFYVDLLPNYRSYCMEKVTVFSPKTLEHWLTNSLFPLQLLPCYLISRIYSNLLSYFCLFMTKTYQPTAIEETWKFTSVFRNLYTTFWFLESFHLNPSLVQKSTFPSTPALF